MPDSMLHGYVQIVPGTLGVLLKWRSFQAGLESGGRIDEKAALSLVTVNLEKALGIEPNHLDDVVVYRGGAALDMTSKAVGVISAARRTVDVF